MEIPPLAVIFIFIMIGFLIVTVSGTLRRKNKISPEQENKFSLVGAFIAALFFGLFFGAILF